jgi:hypothetical protein
VIDGSSTSTAVSSGVTLASAMSGQPLSAARNVAAAAYLASAIILATGALPPALTITQLQSDTAPSVHLTLASSVDSEVSDRSDLIALATISDMTALKPGWAGPHSGPLGAKAEAAASCFVEYLSNCGDFQLPHIGLSNDGEVNFYWLRGDAVLDLGIDSDGRRSFFARLENGNELMQDDMAPDHPLPAELISLISKAA